MCLHVCVCFVRVREIKGADVVKAEAERRPKVGQSQNSGQLAARHAAVSVPVSVYVSVYVSVSVSVSAPASAERHVIRERVAKT